MRALEFIRDHVTLKLPYDFSYHMKTPMQRIGTLFTFVWIFLLISDWCAKLIEYSDYNGWEKVVGETSQLDLNGKYNDKVSSVRVNPGCILILFKHHNNNGELDSLTCDVPSLGAYDDQVSSLSCTCLFSKQMY